ncbi:MAG: Bug family tripartite tricarboxylate transporter substrate binding protein, partial [Alphaproteobacteria bacterium]
MNVLLKTTGITLAIAVAPLSAASADAVADFYKGRTITFYSGGSAGGGFSSVARLVAKHMADRIPGKPK